MDLISFCSCIYNFISLYDIIYNKEIKDVKINKDNSKYYRKVYVIID